MPRLKFIDSLRGLAVAGMLIIHFAEWWLHPEARGTAVFSVLYFASRLLAPIFFFLVGVSLVLKIRSGEEPTGLYGNIVMRGLKLLALGYVLNLLIWGLGEILVWDALHLIGLAAVVCLFLLEYTAYYLRLVLVFVIFLEAPYILDHRVPGLPTYFSLVISGTAPLIYFPIIPWIAYPILGTIIGEFLWAARERGNLRRFRIVLAVAGAVLAIMGLSGRPYASPFDPQKLWQTEFSHPTLAQMVFASGVTFLLFALLSALYGWERGKRGVDFLFRPFELMGREALFVYLVHFLLGYLPLRWLGRLNSWEVLPSAIFTSLFCVFTYLVLYYAPGLIRKIHNIID
ncbi:MAG: heparan-alpha-glucosaminide N-acetyltransferase domain-containing protein [Anaerolineae bacterium]